MGKSRRGGFAAASKFSKRPASRKAAARVAGGAVAFTLDVKAQGREAILGAAYLLTDRAYAWLGGDGSRKIQVELRPKGPASLDALRELAEAFPRELSAQKLRWALSRNNQPIREFIAEQAVLMANGRLPEPAAKEEAAEEQLSEEQRQEIEKLIAEVEQEIQAMSQKKLVSDPKNIKASWEEKQEARRPTGAS